MEHIQLETHDEEYKNTKTLTFTIKTSTQTTKLIKKKQITHKNSKKLNTPGTSHHLSLDTTKPRTIGSKPMFTVSLLHHTTPHHRIASRNFPTNEFDTRNTVPHPRRPESG